MPLSGYGLPGNEIRDVLDGLAKQWVDVIIKL